MMLVLRGGRVLDPSAGLDAFADVVVDGGRIVAVDRGAAALAPKEARVDVDVSGQWVVPGFVDFHTHLRVPGDEHKEDIATGTAAAAAGGFTTVLAMPNTRPVIDDAVVLDAVRYRVERKARVRVHVSAAITRGQRGDELTDLHTLRDAGVRVVTDDGRCVTNSAIMRAALLYARDLDLVVSQHAEDHALTAGAAMHAGSVATELGLRGWPREAEDGIVARDLVLAEATGAHYHLAHASTTGSVRLLREGKARGLSVSAEVTPHHLSLTHREVLGYRTACKVNPPLREEQDVDALREALRDGTIDFVATDHAPHSPREKDCPFDDASPGMIGLETAFAVVNDVGVAPLRLIEVLSTAPARRLGIDAGTLRIGAPADIAVIDPELAWTVSRDSLRSKSANSPWLGRTLRGAIVRTFVGGEEVYAR